MNNKNNVTYDKDSISLKEVFERVVRLDMLMSDTIKDNKRNISKFTGFTFVIITIEIINFIVNFLIWQKIR